MDLDKEQIRRLLKGASLLTTGGGLCYEDQCRSLEKHDEIQIGLKDLNDFAADDILVTAAELGPASAPEIAKAEILPAMVDTWTRLTGKKVAGVYPPEIGQEMIVIDTARALNVPVADFDPAGGRAVPVVDVSALTLAGINFSFSPLVAATDQGDIIAIDTPATPERTEDMLRTMSRLSQNNILYFFGSAIRAGDVQGKSVDNRSLSLAYELGGASSINDLSEKLTPSLTVKGAVIHHNALERDGFNCFTATFAAETGETYTLYILNEVLFMRNEAHKMVGAAPDKILLIDEKRLAGMSTAELLDGKPATLMVAEADQLWRSVEARKLFGPDRFPFLMTA